MKPVDLKDNTYIDQMELHSSKKVNDKEPKLKLVILPEFLSTRVFLQKDTNQIGLKKFL